MDRKMDSGCLEPGETMEDEYDFSQALLPEEIIGIIDQLLCHEVCRLIIGSAETKSVDIFRWRGIWVIRSHKLSLRAFISIDYFPLVLQAFKTRTLTSVMLRVLMSH